MVLINLKELDNFNLEVEVEEFCTFLLAEFASYVCQRGNVLRAKHLVLFKGFFGPFAKGFEQLGIGLGSVNRFARKSGWFNFLGLGRFGFRGRRELSPRTVKADVYCELSLVLVCGDARPVDSNDFSDALANGQVVELVGKEDHGGWLTDFMIIYGGALVSNLDGADVSVGLEGLVRESGIEDNSVDVYLLLANLAFVQVGVFVFSFLRAQ